MDHDDGILARLLLGDLILDVHVPNHMVWIGRVVVGTSGIEIALLLDGKRRNFFGSFGPCEDPCAMTAGASNTDIPTARQVAASSLPKFRDLIFS